MSSTGRAGRAEMRSATEAAQKKRTFPALFLIPRKELERISGTAVNQTTANSAATLRVQEGRVNVRARGICECIRVTLRRVFPSRFFSFANKNKVQVFACRILARFLISSRWQRENRAGVNKM